MNAAAALTVQTRLILLELSAERKSLKLAAWPDILAKAPLKTRALAKPLSMAVKITHRFEGSKKTIDTTVTPDALFGLGYSEGWRFFPLQMFDKTIFDLEALEYSREDDRPPPSGPP